MNIRFDKANQVPIPMTEFDALDTRLCAYFQVATPESNKLMETVNDELGPFSESYLKTTGRRKPNSNGTGSGTHAIRSHVTPVTINGNMHALFYHPTIKTVVENQILSLLPANEREAAKASIDTRDRNNRI